MIHVNSNEIIKRRPRPYLSNGDKIKSLRARLGGVSQEKIANEAGISRRYFIQLETGEKLPSSVVRDKLADALGCDPDEIASSDDEEEIDAMAALTRAVRAVVRETLTKELEAQRS